MLTRSGMNSMKRILILLPIAWALASLPIHAQSKCLTITYVLEGQVLDRSGQPAVGARVRATWIQSHKAAGPVMAAVDRSGRYRLEVPFTPDDDLPMSGPACLQSLGDVSIMAYRGHLRSATIRVVATKPSQRLPVLTIKQ